MCADIGYLLYKVPFQHDEVTRLQAGEVGRRPWASPRVVKPVSTQANTWLIYQLSRPAILPGVGGDGD